ncbi:hypothetical protein NU195Hw_g4871t1 [Hortaea werneckii]
MRTSFRCVPVHMAESDPSQPEPMPFPIRIVADPQAPPPPDSTQPASKSSPPKRSDYFFEAWDKYLSIEPERTKKFSAVAKKIEEEKALIASTPGDGLQRQENAAKSWEQAATECKAKVAAIVQECRRLNQKYRDAVFNLEANSYCLQNLAGRFPNAIDSVESPPWVKRVEDIFDDPHFMNDSGSAPDVHQGNSGDCWFLASLLAVTAKKELIDKVCVARDEACGVYGFVFYRDGEFMHEVIDDKLYLRVGDDDDLAVVRNWDRDEKRGLSLTHDEDKLKTQFQKGDEALYFSHCKSNETWLPLIEKAYAKAHGDYAAIEGGYASEGIEDLTGGVAAVINPEDIMDKNRFWREQLSQVNKKYLFGGGSKPSNAKGLIGSHAYAVLEAWEEGDLKLLKLRNPWGDTEWEGDWADGSKQWTPEMMQKLKHQFGDEGIFWMTYKDFLKHFPAINRVRLFDSDWKVAQQWTCVNVPWTVDYLETKFQFTIKQQGPVVIVLSQPDDRYYQGLTGRYSRSLHFRVYRKDHQDNERWIVRSMHNSGNETAFTRSVSAELDDLEPGTYDVVFKITATRNADATTAEEAIFRYAHSAKEKLLHVGRRFEYANTKGNLRAMEESVKAEKKRMKKSRKKDSLRAERKMKRSSREKARCRKQRKDDAMKEKRKAYKIAQTQKSHRQAQQTSQCKCAESKSTQTEIGGKPSSEDSSEKGFHVVEKKAEAIQEDCTSTADNAENGGNDATEKMANLKLQPDQTGKTDSDLPTTSPPADEDYESSMASPEELSDEDFEFDSEIDGPPSLSDQDSDEKTRKHSKSNEIFADDPWNALCVLGLRVYTLNSEANIEVIKPESQTLA